MAVFRPDFDTVVYGPSPACCRTPDHPIATEVTKQRYELYNRISPLVVGHVADLDSVKVPMDDMDFMGDLDSDDLDDSEFGRNLDDKPDEAKKDEGHGDGMKLGSEESAACKNDDSLSSSLMTDDEDDDNDDSSKDIAEKSVKLTPSSTEPSTEESSSTECKRDNIPDDASEESSEPLRVAESHPLLPDSSVVSDQDGAGDGVHNGAEDGVQYGTQDGVQDRAQDGGALPDNRPTCLAGAMISTDPSQTSHQRHLKAVLQHVHAAMARLTHYFLVAYEHMDNPGSREKIALSVEEILFKQLWQYIITLFR